MKAITLELVDIKRKLIRVLKIMVGNLKLNYRRIVIYLSKRERACYNIDLTYSQIRERFPSNNLSYKYYHHYFWNIAPQLLRNHRAYFCEDFRGFGEDAFHAMWFVIFRDLKPELALEIGIYRGQAISLWGILSRHFNLNSEIHGISPFSSSGDRVSKYLDNINYYEDVVHNLKYFNLPLPYLHKGFSTDKEIVNLIRSRKWDLIYIDGCHDYEIVKQDFIVCNASLRTNGIIVIDDSALFTNYHPAMYSTAGHPGPSKVADEIEPGMFNEIISVGHNRVFQKKR